MEIEKYINEIMIYIMQKEKKNQGLTMKPTFKIVRLQFSFKKTLMGNLRFH